MSAANITIILDDDLQLELDTFKGTPGYEVMLRDMQRRQAARESLRAEQAAATPAMRKRAAARKLLEEDANNPESLRHIHSVLAICSLPYTRQPDHVRDYERRQGRMSLVVTAGKLLSPTGDWQEQPLPYGSRARLLLLHLCSEAIRQKSPTIDIEDSLTAFIRAVGYPVTGGKNGTLNSFKQQINALAACTMRIGVWDGSRSRTINTQPFSELNVWLPTDPAQRVLWPSTITFSRDFFDTLSSHALPVNVDAVRHFSQSPRKLDILFWLGYRLNSLRTPLTISWATMKDQFGQGFHLERQFRAKILEDIAHIREVFPKLPLTATEDGIVLQPADCSVLSIPPRRLLKAS